MIHEMRSEKPSSEILAQASNRVGCRRGRPLKMIWHKKHQTAKPLLPVSATLPSSAFHNPLEASKELMWLWVKTWGTLLDHGRMNRIAYQAGQPKKV